MKSITEIDSLRISCTHEDLQISRDSLFLIAIGVALGTDRGSTSINLLRTDTRNRTLVGLRQDLINPVMVTLEQFRSARINILIVR